MALTVGRCPACGFDPPTVSPADAGVAARSYTRRYRGLLVRPDDDDPEIVHRRPPSGQPSAVEHAEQAAAVLAAAAGALQVVRVRDDPEVDLDPAVAAGGRAALAEVLDRLATGAGDLAAQTELLRGDEWSRAGLEPGGRRVTALDIARHGVHAGIHHLRAAARAIEGARSL